MGDEGGIIILVYGTGSIGLMLATALATEKNCRLILIARAATAALIETEGIHRTGVLGDVSIAPDQLEVYESLTEVPSLIVDHVVIAVKCFQVAEVAAAFAQRPDIYTPNTNFYGFQNGLDSSEPLLSITDSSHIYAARVMTGAHRTHLNRTNVTVHQADLLVGGVSDDAPIAPAEQLAGYLRAGGVPTLATVCIDPMLCEKALFNLGVNGLSALWNRSIGELADDPETRMLMESLIEEGWCAMSAAGRTTRFASFEEYRANFFDNLIPRTREHFSSMHADLKRSNPHTEIDWLNGTITKLARAAGFVAGANQWITARIHQREHLLTQRSRTSPLGGAMADAAVRL